MIREVHGNFSLVRTRTLESVQVFSIDRAFSMMYPLKRQKAFSMIVEFTHSKT